MKKIIENDLDIKLIPYIKNDDFRSVSSSLMYGLNMIQAKSFWEESQKGKGVKIAIIDSGCDIQHENLKDSIIGVRNFTDEDNKNPNIVTDRVGHGTHVTGIIASNGKNGVYGVSPNASIYVLKAINYNGTGKVSWVVNAINYAVQKKVDIISMSLGMSSSSEKLEKSIKNAIRNNIVVVCAAGNEGDGNSESFEYSYPAAYADVISVGAVDEKASPASFTNSNLVIDLLAPGVKIISTYPDNKYASLSGTSMATPYITGSIALLKVWSYNEFKRNLSEEELYAQLIKNTITLDCSRAIQGNGLLFLKKDKIIRKIKY